MMFIFTTRKTLSKKVFEMLYGKHWKNFVTKKKTLWFCALISPKKRFRIMFVSLFDCFVCLGAFSLSLLCGSINGQEKTDAVMAFGS